MARRASWGDFTDIIEAGTYWRRQALETSGSIFSSDPIWSLENFEELNQHFVLNPLTGKDTFLEKLEKQLAPAKAETKKLAAEMLWFMSLCPTNVKPPAKRELVAGAWSFTGEALQLDNIWLQDNVLAGIGSAGTAFNTLRWKEFTFFINFMLKFKALTTEKRDELLDNGWTLAQWIDENIDDAKARQLRPMILFLLFPDEFECIFGGNDRRAIVAAYDELPLRDVSKLQPSEIDRRLFDIRQREQKKSTSELQSFYDPPLVSTWQTASGAQGIKTIEREHILKAIKKIDSEGVPSDAQSTYYDLIYEGERYPPKYVLSLAGEFANGIKLNRELFSGGDQSTAFRHIRKLGFHIEAKDALANLVRSFLEQADEGTKLGTTGYPNKHSDLDVVVSFGKGNFARVPWVAFLGYGQEVTSGIYPVLLYYKSEGLLVLSYGKSETHTASIDWPNISPDKTIFKVLTSKHNVAPARYGASYVKAIYKVPEEIELNKIAEDIESLLNEYKTVMKTLGITDTEKGDETIIFSPDEALEELFIEPERFDVMLSTLKRKKNLILQGPPGVGKTFVCKKLAYALIGEEDSSRVSMVQFHQTYSYEDFIQGYRPSQTGFNLKDGVFYQFCNKAHQDLANDYVFIIDEINRGNLSKIFGELMMLIEADKRAPDWAIPLAYGDNPDEKFYIPENLYIVGLMNTADRSLAMVDYALRRRFGFIDLIPGFNTEQFYGYLKDRGAEEGFVEELTRKITSLNKKIEADKSNLGPGFCIGHSFFCSLSDSETPSKSWYNQIIENEIAPLLKEYWFDAPETADSLHKELLMRD